MPVGDIDEPYELILIGRGSAAAYYLESLPRRYREEKGSREELPMSILVLGKQDPWAGARGYSADKEAYGRNINQAQQVLAHRTGGTASTSQAAQDRLGWAVENDQILKTVSRNNVHDATVTMVEEIRGECLISPKKFKVTSDLGVKYALRVVIATGSGVEGPGGHADYHDIPDEVKKGGFRLPHDQVMNLDQYMAMGKDKHAGKKVAVLGPIAGTDAVLQAITMDYSLGNIYWLMRTSPNTAGLKNVHPGDTKAQQDKIQAGRDGLPNRQWVYKANTLSLASSSGKVRVAADPVDASPLKDRSVDVDYFVFSTGQTAKNILTAPPKDDKDVAKGFLTPELLRKLEPIYDVNQRLGERGADSAPYQHVCGLQLEGSNSQTGLTVIGAASFQVAATKDRGIEHNFLQYDYMNALSTLHTLPFFKAVATRNYRELLPEDPGSIEVPLRKVARLSDNTCEVREQVFLTAFWEELDQGLDGYVKDGLILESEKAAMVERRMVQARQLCYLFSQRTRAAKYLFDAKDKEGKPVADRGVQSMLRATHGLPEALQDCRLLAGIQANVGAINASMPSHLATKTSVEMETFQANFLEDKSQLRAYISAHYPDIPEDEAQMFIGNVAALRKPKGNMGFNQGEIVAFERQLQSLQKAASPGKTAVLPSLAKGGTWELSKNNLNTLS
jgi:hypothetical protein